MDGHVAIDLKNASTLLALAESDLGISPTSWQRSTFPDHFQSKIDIVHEGVDVDLVKPAPDETFQLTSGRKLTRSDEVVTFAARNLEPLRGYHVFMRALPEVMRRRPLAEILIVGGHNTSYGAAPAGGGSWKSIFLAEVNDFVDPRRIHYVGHLSFRQYLKALQISSAHVYFTYPFVLSWSLLEAMSAGCLVIGSDTPPVREIIDGDNGVLTPFFDVQQLADRIVDALRNPPRYEATRNQARETILKRYDLRRICIPASLRILRQVTRTRLDVAARMMNGGGAPSDVPATSQAKPRVLHAPRDRLGSSDKPTRSFQER